MEFPVAFRCVRYWRLLVLTFVGLVVFYVVYSREVTLCTPGSTCVPSGIFDYLSGKKDTDTEACFSEYKFAASPLNVTALASFPRSGNSWTRRMLTIATGIYTGTIYHDPRPAGDLFYPPVTPITNGSALVVKTHRPEDANRLSRRAILLLRNPFDSLASDYCRTRGSTKCLRALNRTAELTSIFSKRAHDWYVFYILWFQLDGPLLIIKYENLVKDPATELRRMIKFLGFSTTRIHCALERLPLRPHAPMSAERVTQLFTPEQVEEIKRYREKVFDMADVIISRQSLT